MEIGIEDLKIIQPRQPILSVEIDTDNNENGNHREIIEKVLINYALKNPNKTISVYDEVHSSVNFHNPTSSVFFVFARSVQLAEYVNGALLRWKIRSKLSDSILPELSDLAYHIENGKAWRRADMGTFELLGKQPDEES